MSPRARSGWMAAVIALAVGAVVLHLVRGALSDSRVPFLAQRAGAEWIVFPTQPTTLTRAAVELPTRFERTFEVAGEERAAKLRVRMHRAGEVELNGRRVELPAVRDWKCESEVDVGALLVAGENRLVATISAKTGPPALWLALDGDGWRVASDATWNASYAGSAVRTARLARTPMSEWASPSAGSAIGELASDELNTRPSAALARSLGPIAVALAVAVALVFAVRSRLARFASSSRAYWTLVALAIAVQAALFVNDRELALDRGFDAPAHLEYVDFLRTHGRVPFADEGWSMYQPPLYYALAAGALELCDVATDAPEAKYVLRALGFVALALQTILVAATLRRLLGERTAWLGVVFASALPMQLYLFQYATNEALAATLISACVWLAVELAERDDTRLWTHAALGALLGAALLTKFSALLALIVIASVLAAKLALSRERSARVWLRTVGALLVACVLVCGWYYARVYERFGELLVWNLDEATGFAWWQDPGYRTSGDFARFGASLERPLFSAFASIPDALYSTLWCDGLLGGSPRVDVRPPWDFELLAAGAWLALPLTIALSAGAFLALRDLIARPRSSHALVLGLAGATLAALASLTLSLPSYAQAKSVYASSVIVALAFVFARALAPTRTLLRRAASLVDIALVAWALLCFASFWSCGPAREQGLDLRPSALTAFVKANLIEQFAGDARLAEEHALAAVRSAPDSLWAQRNLAFVRFKLGDRAAALQAARDALAIAPWTADVQQLAGVLSEATGARAEAKRHFEWSLRVDPSAAPYALRLAALHEADGEIEAARAVLVRSLDAARTAGLEAARELESALDRLPSRT